MSKQDADLWAYTARTVEPLRRAKARVTTGAEIPAVNETPPPVPPSRGKPGDDARGHHTPRWPHAAAPPLPPRRAPPPLADLDRRKARKIAIGHIDIEARIDLHGLRQSDAHRRLRSFLLNAHAEGLRTVLVITGKGRPRPANDRSDVAASREQRGIIRRMVPMWLEDADLRAVVLSFSSAHARHGGDGALYVQLRKARLR